MIVSILENRISEKQLSIRAAAREIGIAHTTLNRILDGGNIDLDTIYKISDWVGIKPSELLGFNTGDDVSLLVSSIPGLTEILSEAAEKVNSGEIDISALADITAYARFRVRENYIDRREKGNGGDHAKD